MKRCALLLAILILTASVGLCSCATAPAKKSSPLNWEVYFSQAAYGDWQEFFTNDRIDRWGTTKDVPELSKAKTGDTIIAYQTDRNEIVGSARVVGFKTKGANKHLMLKPLEMIGAKVRPLKQSDPKIRTISALRQGPIHTLYRISSIEAKRLLQKAKASLRPDFNIALKQAETNAQGAGFGTTEHNRKVERGAINFVICHYTQKRWRVKDISKRNLGYDLVCIKGSIRMHVEVKGATGGKHQFIITAKEKHTWDNDKRFRLALVTNALNSNRNVLFYKGLADLKKFTFNPISYIATFRG
jgi:hypothetical protein